MNKVIKIEENKLKHIIKESVKNIITNFVTDIKETTTNKSKLVSLNESNAMHLINKHTKDGYVIVSPCKGYDFLKLNKDNPQDVEKKHQIDHQRIKSLINKIKKNGLSYTPIYGGYPEEDDNGNIEDVYERSFIIYPYDRDGHPIPFDKLREFALDMCNQYNQDSVLIKAPNENPKYITGNDTVDMEFDGNTKFNDMSEPYFSDLYTGDKDEKHSRFIFKECYINPAPQSYSERHIRYLNGEVFLNG